MTFSIIVPVYNVAPFLCECLDSLLSQTCPSWEAICVNDGSTDGSGDILNDYACRDGRIRVVHCPNAGVSNARNIAIEKSRGDFLLFLDGDDLLTPTLLANLSKCIVESPQVDVVGFDVDELLCDGSRRPYFKSCDEGLYVGDQLLASIRLAESRYLWAVWDKAFRRELVCGCGIKFDVKLANGEDSLFAQEALAFAGKVLLMPKLSGYVYRQRVGSAALKTRDCLPQDPIAPFRHLHALWRRLRTHGLCTAVGYNAALLFSLGKVGNFMPEVRSEAIDYLVDTKEFSRTVIPFLIFHGTLKSRLVACVFLCLPKKMKRILLGLV